MSKLKINDLVVMKEDGKRIGVVVSIYKNETYVKVLWNGDFTFVEYAHELIVITEEAMKIRLES